MDWVYIAIIAYTILAVGNLTDKFLLDKALPSSKAYTFLVNIAGGLVIFGAPFLAKWVGWPMLFVHLLVGAIFPLALSLMYQALKNGEPSRVTVLVGGSVPLFSLIFSITFLHEKFNANQWPAIIGLIIAMCLIIWLPKKRSWLDNAFSWFSPKKNNAIGIFEAVAAGFFFAVFAVASKALYSNLGFISTFIWLRLGSALAVLTLLISPNSRREIIKSIKNLQGKKAAIFYGNQMLSAVGYSLQQYAISLGSLAIVSALQGVQFSLLIIFGALLSAFRPGIIKEKISRGIIIQKVIAVIIIIGSIYLLTKK